MVERCTRRYSASSFTVNTFALSCIFESIPIRLIETVRRAKHNINEGQVKPSNVIKTCKDWFHRAISSFKGPQGMFVSTWQLSPQ